MDAATSLESARRFMRYAMEDGVSMAALKFALSQEAGLFKGERQEHGRSGYAWGCRCQVCGRAQRDYMTEYRSRVA